MERRALAGLLSEGGHAIVDYEGCAIPLRFDREGRRDVLVVSFHGAVSATKRPPPVFVPPFGDVTSPVHLAISDPLFLDRVDISTNWFIGTERHPLQDLVHSLVQEALDLLKIDSVIFLGGSAGGFPALFHSHRVPGSVAVVGGAQTVLTPYRGSLLAQELWPGLGDAESLADHVVTDLPDLYGQGHENLPIFLVAAGDRKQLSGHLYPMLNALEGAGSSNYIVNVDYWGTPGHAGAVPGHQLRRWIAAAADAAADGPDAVLARYHELRPRPERKPAPFRKGRSAPPDEPERSIVTAEADELALARQLRDLTIAKDAPR
ncbi:hypothetical protein JQC91_14765 [Jannaschia sp. Os4]|uniref:hypothetical protein n=1 Tax=Jannaschia sp. Os4 TaxID=2807617 RepID=UPI00193ADF85|nr:hypothetical protein [Jannaschia sp. Os4]MBM2577566.1 hypothetical protein [Jannaschia sp. Os4]